MTKLVSAILLSLLFVQVALAQLPFFLQADSCIRPTATSSNIEELSSTIEGIAPYCTPSSQVFRGLAYSLYINNLSNRWEQIFQRVDSVKRALGNEAMSFGPDSPCNPQVRLPPRCADNRQAIEESIARARSQYVGLNPDRGYPGSLIVDAQNYSKELDFATIDRRMKKNPQECLSTQMVTLMRITGAEEHSAKLSAAAVRLSAERLGGIRSPTATADEAESARSYDLSLAQTRDYVNGGIASLGDCSNSPNLTEVVAKFRASSDKVTSGKLGDLLPGYGVVLDSLVRVGGVQSCNQIKDLLTSHLTFFNRLQELGAQDRSEPRVQDQIREMLSTMESTINQRLAEIGETRLKGTMENYCRDIVTDTQEFFCKSDRSSALLQDRTVMDNTDELFNGKPNPVTSTNRCGPIIATRANLPAASVPAGYYKEQAQRIMRVRHQESEEHCDAVNQWRAQVCEGGHAKEAECTARNIGTFCQIPGNAKRTECILLTLTTSSLTETLNTASLAQIAQETAPMGRRGNFVERLNTIAGASAASISRSGSDLFKRGTGAVTNGESAAFSAAIAAAAGGSPQNQEVVRPFIGLPNSSATTTNGDTTPNVAPTAQPVTASVPAEDPNRATVAALRDQINSLNQALDQQRQAHDAAGGDAGEGTTPKARRRAPASVEAGNDAAADVPADNRIAPVSAGAGLGVGSGTGGIAIITGGLSSGGSSIGSTGSGAALGFPLRPSVEVASTQASGDGARRDLTLSGVNVADGKNIVELRAPAEGLSQADVAAYIRRTLNPSVFSNGQRSVIVQLGQNGALWKAELGANGVISIEPVRNQEVQRFVRVNRLDSMRSTLEAARTPSSGN